MKKIDKIREKANCPGWGYDGDNGTNDVILFLLSEVDRWKELYLKETVG